MRIPTGFHDRARELAAVYYAESIEYGLTKVFEELDKRHVSYVKPVDLEYIVDPEDADGIATACPVIYIRGMDYKQILELWDEMSKIFSRNIDGNLRGLYHLILKRATSAGDQSSL